MAHPKKKFVLSWVRWLLLLTIPTLWCVLSYLDQLSFLENKLVDRLTAQKGIKITYNKIDGANHFFDKHEADVVEAVKGYVSDLMSKPREGR